MDNKCAVCGTEKKEYTVFWCGEWEEVDMCPHCDIARDEDSGMEIVQ